jgi:outer membrane protein TolC
VAYESRYVAERQLIYAVRSYERFRRTFLVGVAGAYFDAQNLKQTVRNTQKSYLTRVEQYERAEFIERMGRSDSVLDTFRAESSLRRAESGLAQATERYQSAMDQFKILIGMPVAEELNVIDQAEDVASDSLDDLLTDVPLEEAIDTALHYRLDLLNDADRVDDARRGVVIAKNQVLPDLDFRGQLISRSDPNHLSATTFSTDRTFWQAGLQLRVDDRRTEINQYRESMIFLRRAQRGHDQFRDEVRADVRRAVRRIAQTAAIREIEEQNALQNAERLEAAKVQFELGRADNLDVVNAEDELLDARNTAAAAVAAYRVSILAYRRDTGTLRVAEDGSWIAARTGESGDPVTGP